VGSVITVENLGKKYMIGHQRRAGRRTLRDAMTHAARGLWQRLRHPLSPNRESVELEEVWALRDVGFEVQPGERIGIIGRNGAGKSTLLKILSRITEPTTGRIRLRGRVSSLLEVGTGFHPELTGRENVFLNGAILGMTRREITKKFDEIVAFAEIERFLDTPVKRYSSGMYVRLAFAVAAHLEPEILIVDEVLAVGDAQFQRKCLGKMGEVAGQGRTVLFVSHNMGAIAGLCERCIWISDGHLQAMGASSRIINEYLNQNQRLASVPLNERTDRTGTGEVRFVDFSVARSPFGPSVSQVFLGDEVFLRLGLASNQKTLAWVGLTIKDQMGNQLIRTNTRLHGAQPCCVEGRSSILLHFPRFLLGEGRYSVDLGVMTPTLELADKVPNAAEIEVLSHDLYGTGCPVGSDYGIVHLPHEWVNGDRPEVELQRGLSLPPSAQGEDLSRVASGNESRGQTLLRHDKGGES
jgi:lipopolysaccharide transport system ATP-binding protein